MSAEETTLNQCKCEGSISQTQGAIKFGGDGVTRVLVEIPECYKAEAAKLITMVQKPLKIDIRAQ